MSELNRRIVLAARPNGMPVPGDFRLEEVPVPVPGVGEILLQALWLSLDPYMRTRMSAAKSYAAQLEIGDVMVGGTVGKVLASRHPDYAVGEIVSGYTGWQTHAISDGTGLVKVDPALAPISTALGVLGMPGMTAYTGLLNIGRPKAGETLVVGAATGPVGSLVGQIAKLQGCRTVAIAGGAEKCRYATEVLGFDAALDHHAADLAAQLAKACPKGIDIYWENVGGKVWDAVLPLLNDFARVPVCGVIAHYNDQGRPSAEATQRPDRTAQLMLQVLFKRLHLQGFIVSDFAAQAADFRRDVAAWLRDGKIVYREDVVAGLERAPEALIGLLQGRNFGKLLVKVAEG